MLKNIVKFLFSRATIVIAVLLIQVLLLLHFVEHLIPIIPIIFGSVAFLSMIVIFIILNSKDNPSVKLSWLAVVSFVPILGAFFYFFFNLNIGRILYGKKIARGIKHSKKFDQGSPIELSAAKDTNNLANYLYKQGGYRLFSNTKVDYYPLGELKWEAMKQEIRKAKEFIFLEYFIIEEGLMWDQLLALLIQKVKEGVEVRVMYDGTCAFSTLSFDYDKQLRKQGIKCKVFAPIKPFMSTHYNNRDHRKILVIDNKVAFNGGVNLADEYINQKIVHGHWKDTAIRLQGEAVYNLTLMFLQMWNEEEDFTPYLKAHSTNEEGYVISYGDNPYDEERVGEMVYLDIINRAEEYVYIMSPYLIIDNEMITALSFAAKRGVDIRIVLPHIPDKKFVHIQARSHYQELITAGVKIYEYTPGFTHGKMFISDDEKVVVGTINLDYRSLYLHFECATYLYQHPVISTIKEDYLNTLELSQMIQIEDIKKDPLWNRVLGKLLKIFSPIM